MRRQLVQCCYAGLAALLLVPAAAFAQAQAVTNSSVNLRAGPARDYPVVSQLPGGLPVTVMGCVAGYSWCDVATPNLRGWVYAGRLNYAYQGNPVPVLGYGNAIGLPIVTFSIGTYWGNYYRGRPWYRDQSRWAHRPPPRPGPGAGRPPGRPPGGPGSPGGRPPGGRPPGNVGGRPPGGPPPGAGGRPPGGRPPGGQPPGGQPPGGGGRPPGGGGKPPGGGGGRPPGGGGGRPPAGGGGGQGARPPGGGGGGGGQGGRPPGGG